MTINSLSPIQSTPFTGVGTQTYNVQADGQYTVSANVSIPWQSSDAPGSTLATKNAQTVSTVADSSGSLNSTYFTFYDAGDVHGWYVWFNINSAGVDPAVAGLTAVPVAGATDVTANTLATAARAAIVTATAGYVVVTGATDEIILTNVGRGACTAAADGEDATGFDFDVGTAGSYGSGSGLVVKVQLEGDDVLTLSQPTPTQPLLAGQVTFEAEAGDVITVVMSSLATADAKANAVN